MIQSFDLADALRALGPAEVLIGDPLTADGMVSLGAIEGGITFDAPVDFNWLTAKERTGGIPHQGTATAGLLTIKAPVILGDPALWSKVNVFGGKGWGYARPQVPHETSVLLIPLPELGGGLEWDPVTNGGQWNRLAGNGIAAASDVEAKPLNSIWFWRAVASFGSVPYQETDGGKATVDVTFTAMYCPKLGVVDIPDGFRAAMVGDPRTDATTPIPVVL